MSHPHQDLTRTTLVRAVHRRPDRGLLLDHAPVPAGDRLGRDPGHRHLAADAPGAAPCGNRRGVAVLVMTLALLLVLIVPLLAGDRHHRRQRR